MIIFIVIALKILAGSAILLASFLTLFSDAEGKYQRIACLYLSSIAYSVLALALGD